MQRRILWRDIEAEQSTLAFVQLHQRFHRTHVAHPCPSMHGLPDRTIARLEEQPRLFGRILGDRFHGGLPGFACGAPMREATLGGNLIEGVAHAAHIQRRHLALAGVGGALVVACVLGVFAGART